MFTDGPSPNRPPRESSGNVLTIAIIVVLGLGAYALSERIKSHNEEVDRQALRASRPASPPQIPAPIAKAVAPPLDADRRPRSGLAVVEPPDVPARTTIYLCKSYGGGSFWSNASCSTQRASIDRMTSVPGYLSFQEQVAIASGEAQEAAKLYATPVPAAAGVIGAAPAVSQRPAECALLDQQVRDLDAWSRSPQSGQMQDRIREERSWVMGRRALLRC